MSTWSIPYGRSSLTFSLPDDANVTLLEPRPTRLDGVETDPDTALAHPLGSPRLEALASGKRDVVIVVTDATRACPDHLLVPPMLRALERSGVPDEAVTLLVAVGAHRASTEAEKREKLGDAIVDRYRVIDHDGADPDQLVKVLDGPGGHPFLVNRRAVEADLLLSTGIVEPHQYAGFSGGAKTVAIGCAGENIIAYTHGPAMIDLPGTRLANLATNPFQQAVREVARAAGLDFVANAVLGPDGELAAVSYGAAEPVHDALAAVASALMTVDIPHQYDVAIAGVGYPKDENLYQTSRAASYLQFAPTPVVRPGGTIIIPATCHEGAGKGAGEQRFAATMRATGGPAEIIAHARAQGIKPGEQRAYVMAQVLAGARVVIVGAADPVAIEAMGFATALTIEEAVNEAMTDGAAPEIVVIPHALTTLPIVREEPATLLT